MSFEEDTGPRIRRAVLYPGDDVEGVERDETPLVRHAAVRPRTPTKPMHRDPTVRRKKTRAEVEADSLISTIFFAIAFLGGGLLMLWLL